MRKAAVIELNQEKRQTWQKLAKARSSKRHEALRVRAVSLAAEDRTNLQISAEVGLHYNAIGKTRARLVRERLGGGRKVRPHQTHWPPQVRDNGHAHFFCIDDRRQVSLGNGVFTKPLPPSDWEKSDRVRRYAGI
jgi:hypothetical protein